MNDVECALNRAMEEASECPEALRHIISAMEAKEIRQGKREPKVRLTITDDTLPFRVHYVERN